MRKQPRPKLRWLAINHPDPSNRIEAIQALRSENNQDLFHKIVYRDPVIEVRIAAFNKILAHDILLEIAENHPVQYARDAALNRLPDYTYAEEYIRLLKQEKTGDIRAKLLHKIPFQNNEDLFLHYLRTDRSDYVAETVTNYLEDQELLFDIVIHGRTHYQKIIALSKINTLESLYQLRLLTSPDIQKQLRDKIKQLELRNEDYH